MTRPDVAFKLDDRENTYELTLFPNDLFVKFVYDVEAYRAAHGMTHWGPPTRVTTMSKFLNIVGGHHGNCRNWVVNQAVDTLMSGGSIPCVGTGGYYLNGETRNEEAVWAVVSLATLEEQQAAEEVLNSWKGSMGPKSAARTTRSETYYSIKASAEDIERATLPRQAKTVAMILLETGMAKIAESTVESLMDSNAARIKTKQPPMRIFKYYVKPLIEAEIMEEVSATTPERGVAEESPEESQSTNAEEPQSTNAEEPQSTNAEEPPCED